MTSINTSIIPNDDENEDLLKDCEKNNRRFNEE
jgi:hypothetical protein